MPGSRGAFFDKTLTGDMEDIAAVLDHVKAEFPAARVSRGRAIGQILEGSFSALSMPNFARKNAFDSSRQNLLNALKDTVLGIHFWKLGKKGPGQNNPEKVKARGH